MNKDRRILRSMIGASIALLLLPASVLNAADESLAPTAVVAASAATINNPSFEDEPDGTMPNGISTSDTSTWGMPADWSWRNQGATNGHGVRFYDPVGWRSDGDWSLYVFASTAGPHVPGDYLEFYQAIDLTDVPAIAFDVNLLGGGHTNSYFAVGQSKLWVNNLGGTHYDVVVDVSTFSGLHEIAVGVEVFEQYGCSADGWTYFDNLRIVPEPGGLLLLAMAAARRRQLA